MNPRSTLLAVITVIAITLIAGCKKDNPPVLNYPLGIFPDSVIVLEGLNSPYDDYNSDIWSNEYGVLSDSRPIVFSSNRLTSGGTFDLVYGMIGYDFGQTSGLFLLISGISQNGFLTALTTKFNTPANDFGPYRFFNSEDGHEYMVTATEVTGRGLDIVYSGFTPAFSAAPVIPDPVPATLFNSASDDAYPSFDSGLDTAYFCSDRDGNFDIYSLLRPSVKTVEDWFLSPAATPLAVDSLKTSWNEKCPFVSGRYLVFVSDMPGGMGGQDLYYSVFRGGKWSSPVNLGPKINSSYNEYRPVIGRDLQFENHFLVFSSDRPGGKGGYDLYFAGLTLE